MPQGPCVVLHLSFSIHNLLRLPPDPAQSDAALIAAANAGGDEGRRAFEALYHRYRDWVVNLAFRFTRDADGAADVAQEVFIYLLKKFPGFELTARLTTFLYPAVKNLSHTWRLKSRRFAGNDEALALQPDRAATAAADRAALGQADPARAELAQVMERLSEAHREVLLLRFVDDLSLAEIADMLGVPVGTVKSRIHHAIGALRDDPRVKDFFEISQEP